ncbi:hypothetical protein HYY75_06565, partial [bacterium]|nr:hypothetical protein [bacterium]
MKSFLGKAFKYFGAPAKVEVWALEKFRPIIKAAVLFLIFSLASVTLLKAELWPCTTIKIEDGVRLGERWTHNPCVVKLLNGSFRMYFSDASCDQNYPIVVKSAISRDGLSWEKEDGIRIGAGHGGQNGWANSADVKILSDGTYRMYFSSDVSILSAVSKDGVTWEKEEGVRINNDSCSQKSVQGSLVVFLPMGGYRMYYCAGDGKNYKIFSAISSDGLSW